MGSPGGGLDAEALERCSHRRPAFPAGGYNTKRPGSPECFGDPGLIHVSRVRIQLRGVSADNAFSRSGPSEPTDGHAGVATTTRPTPTAPAWVQAARAGRATDSARSRPACRRHRCAIMDYSMLCNQWMLDCGMGWNGHQCRRMVDALVEAGVVERHDAFNPNNPQFPTSAVRLVRTNETVRRTLGFNSPPISNPVLRASG